jgi:hypothetical protein
MKHFPRELPVLFPKVGEWNLQALQTWV